MHDRARTGIKSAQTVYGRVARKRGGASILLDDRKTRRELRRALVSFRDAAANADLRRKIAELVGSGGSTSGSANGGPAAATESTPSSAGVGGSQQTAKLVRQEIRLAQVEPQQKGKQAGLGAGLLGGGGLVALYGVGALVAAAILALDTAMPGWAAALIVGGSPPRGRGGDGAAREERGR